MVAYFLGLLLILLTSSLVIIVGFSQISSFSYATTNQTVLGVPVLASGTMITEQDVKTVYNSRVPVTIADAVNSINSLSGKLLAYPLTLTPVDINGTIPLVIRGIPNNVILAEGLTSQAANQTSIIVLVGSKAQARVGATLGDSLRISSPFTPSPINVTVGGFFTTGTEEDYEVVVSFTLGEQIAGLPKGIASAVIIPPSITFSPDILAYDYHFSIQYNGPSGNLLLIDSSGYVHDSAQISSSSNSNFTHQTLDVSLSYGLYTAVLERGGLRTTVGQFVTAVNNSALTLNSALIGTSGFLTVKAANSSPAPTLLNSSNYRVSPDYFDQSAQVWVFQVPFGTYSLILNGSSHQILVFGNVTFDPNTPSMNSLLNVNLYGSSNQPIAYSITVEDVQSSETIFSSFSTDPFLSIPVEANHSYTVAVLTTDGLLIQQNVTVLQNDTSLRFDIPYVPQQLQNVPVSDYASLGLGFPSQSASFNYFFGTTIASTIALFSIIILLLVLTLLAFDSQFLVSLRNEVKAISYMFPRPSLFFWKVSGPMLLLSVMSAGVGIAISFALFQLLGLDSRFTFVGYGIQLYPIIFVGPSLVMLSLLSWVRISLFFKTKVFATREGK